MTEPQQSWNSALDLACRLVQDWDGRDVQDLIDKLQDNKTWVPNA